MRSLNLIGKFAQQRRGGKKVIKSLSEKLSVTELKPNNVRHISYEFLLSTSSSDCFALSNTQKIIESITTFTT